MYIEYTPIELFDEPEQHLQYPTTAAAATTTTTGFGVSGSGGGSITTDGFFERKSRGASRRCSEYSSIATTNSSDQSYIGGICGSGGGDSSSFPMGFDIVAKIKNILSFSDNSESLSRKRRAIGDWNNSSQIKLRKVESNRKITPSFEEDDVNIIPERILKASLAMAQKKQQYQNEKKSQFVRPKTVNKHFTNTAFADIEYSDDEDDKIIFTNGNGECFNVVRKGNIGRPTTSRSTMMSSSTPNVINIPIKQGQPPLPPLIEARTGGILASTLMPDLQPIRHSKYSSFFTCANGFGNKYTNNIGAKGSTSNDRHVPTQQTTAPIIYNGNIFAGQSRALRSIIDQEYQTKEHEQYSELLQRMIPDLYGITGTSPKPPPTVKVLPTLNRSKPTPMTIDLTVRGSSNRKNLVNNTLADEFSDDDVSEIIDLDDEELNMISACSKLQKEEAECSYDVKKRAAEKKKQLPYVEPVNSLKDKFDLLPICKSDWLQCFNLKWEKKRLELKQELAETEKEVEERSAETRFKEKQMQARLKNLQIVDPDLIIIDDFPESDEEPEFPEITHDNEAVIKNALFNGPDDQLLISKFSMRITRRDIATILGKNWLNDEVINFYMNLLMERSEKGQQDGLPKVYTMNTFFVPKLLQAGYSGVRRWTRKVDIFSYDIIPVPVHVGGFHWCMAIIHMRDRAIRYYDSMGTPNPQVLNILEQYLRDESLEKRKKPFDTSDFLIENVADGPRQMNGCDCGVFSCMFAEYITRDRVPTFQQQHMEYFRHRMILEIVQGRLMQ